MGGRLRPESAAGIAQNMQPTPQRPLENAEKQEFMLLGTPLIFYTFKINYLKTYTKAHGSGLWP